jgi:hypothetical protein
MAYVKPTPTEMKALFPAFASVPDPTIQAWLDVAARSVDETWIEGDYKYGIMLLAAHLMVGAGIGTGAEAEANASGMGSFSTIRSGQLTLTRGSFADRGVGDVPSPWNATRYGVEWYWLARKNKPPAAVTADAAGVGVSYPFLVYEPYGNS